MFEKLSNYWFSRTALVTEIRCFVIYPFAQKYFKGHQWTYVTNQRTKGQDYSNQKSLNFWNNSEYMLNVLMFNKLLCTIIYPVRAYSVLQERKVRSNQCVIIRSLSPASHLHSRCNLKITKCLPFLPNLLLPIQASHFTFAVPDEKKESSEMNSVSY
jgi:hypothetical protein